MLWQDISAYMQDVAKYPLLSAEEEHELARRMTEEGDKEAEQQLVNCNLRLVVKIAHSFTQREDFLNDLVQEGNIGLMTAIKKFDYSKDIKLSTYATWWIRQSMSSFVLNNKLIRLPVQKELMMRRVLLYMEDYYQSNHSMPSLENISQFCRIKYENLLEMWQFHEPVHSPHAHIDEEMQQDLFEIVGDNRYNPAYTIRRWILKNKLKQLFACLDEKENFVIRMRFALGSSKPVTLKAISKHLGISVEGARLIERRALKKLRQQEEEIRPLLDELIQLQEVQNK